MTVTSYLNGTAASYVLIHNTRKMLNEPMSYPSNLLLTPRLPKMDCEIL